MKIYSHLLQFCLWLAACLPLPSHAGIEVPYWMYPEWIAAKMMDFHARNTERFEQQAQTKATAAAANTSPNTSVNTPVNANPSGMPNEKVQRKPNLATVETANVKVNEKQLSKDELMELRKQLREK